MPRKNLGKKLDVNGNLQDLGNTVSDEDLEKFDGIEEGSQKNVQADWNSTSGDSFIKNKPSVVTTDTAQTISGLKTFTNGIKLGEYGLQIKGDALNDPDFDSIVDPGFYFCKEIFNGPIDFTGMATLEGETGGALIVLPDRTQIVSYWGKIFARKFSIGQSVSTYAISGGGSTTTLPTVPAVGAYGEWVEIIDSDNEVFNFAQEEYNKSANLFDEQVTLGGVNIDIGEFYYTPSGDRLLSVNYMPMKPSTVYSYATSKSGLWICEYDANGNFLGYVDIVSGSSFTSKPNTAYFKVAFWSGYGTTYLNDAIVKEGTNPVYQPYNSSSHITNGQADLLKSEYEKGLNLFTQGVNSNYFVGYLEAGKNYCISADLVIPSGTTLYTGTIKRYYPTTGTTSDNAGAITRTYKTFSTSGRHSYTLTCNVSGYYEIETFNKPTDVDVSNIMINKGSEALPYQPYYGEIVHDKEFQELKNTVSEKADNPGSYFKQMMKYTEANTYLELDLNALLPSSNNRTQIKIEGIRNGGGTVFALIGVANRTNSTYLSTVVTTLGSHEISASFNIDTQILRIGNLNNYGTYLITIIS